MAIGLELKVRKFWELTPTFGEVKEEKLVRGAFLATPILNRVKIGIPKHFTIFTGKYKLLTKIQACITLLIHSSNTNLLSSFII